MSVFQEGGSKMLVGPIGRLISHIREAALSRLGLERWKEKSLIGKLATSYYWLWLGESVARPGGGVLSRCNMLHSHSTSCFDPRGADKDYKNPLASISMISGFVTDLRYPVPFFLPSASFLPSAQTGLGLSPFQVPAFHLPCCRRNKEKTVPILSK